MQRFVCRPNPLFRLNPHYHIRIRKNEIVTIIRASSDSQEDQPAQIYFPGEQTLLERIH